MTDAKNLLLLYESSDISSAKDTRLPDPIWSPASLKGEYRSG